MTEVVQRDVVPGAPGSKYPGRSADESAEQDRRDVPPRSDVGTIFLHWATAIAFVVSLFTGIRMATFGHVLPSLSQWLSPIMPQGEMWTWHFFAGSWPVLLCFRLSGLFEPRRTDRAQRAEENPRRADGGRRASCAGRRSMSGCTGLSMR